MIDVRDVQSRRLKVKKVKDHTIKVPQKLTLKLNVSHWNA